MYKEQLLEIVGAWPDEWPPSRRGPVYGLTPAGWDELRERYGEETFERVYGARARG